MRFYLSTLATCSFVVVEEDMTYSCVCYILSYSTLIAITLSGLVHYIIPVLFNNSACKMQDYTQICDF